MKVRKLSVLLMAAVITLCCSCETTPEKEYPELEYGIKEYSDTAVCFEEGKFGTETYLCEPYEKPYVDKSKVAEAYLEDPVLQTAAAKIQQGKPLDTDREILTLAWELHPILEQETYIPEGFLPVAAMGYSNGIVAITYIDGAGLELEGWELWSRIDDREVTIYFSQKDGHIVTYTAWL